MRTSLSLAALAFTLGLPVVHAAGGARAEVVTRVTLASAPLDRARLTMPGFAINRTPGQPPLPERSVQLALHPQVDPASVRVEETLGPQESLPGRQRLLPNPPALLIARGRATRVWVGAERPREGKDLAAYGEGVFPRTVIRQRGLENRGGIVLLNLRFMPLRYRHATGELLLARHAALTVRYRLKSDRPAPLAIAADLAQHLEPTLNLEQARSFYPRTETAARPGYAIVIRDGLRKKSQALGPFVAHKESLGFAVTVVSDDALSTVAAPPAADDADRIRLWLQQHYRKLNLRFVLLIGNPDPTRPGVPMKLTYSMARNAFNRELAPTDHYFADLTGNWDLDGDGMVAEFPDDDGPGGVDLAPEVYVGRIPVYDENAVILDQILTKTVAYQLDRRDRSWRKRVLQPAAMLFLERQYGDENKIRVDGADIADAIYQQVIKKAGFGHTPIYERAGVDPSQLASPLDLGRENVLAEWRKGYGLVNMVGHGSASGIFRLVWHRDNGDKVPGYGEVAEPPFLRYDDVGQLDDTRPSFVFHASCSNATPESPDNLAYGLLRSGAVGTVSSTRVALVLLTAGPAASQNIFGLARAFTDQLLRGKSAGEAIFEAKQQIAGDAGPLYWFTKLEIGLYGDPSLPLMTCTADAQCDDGLRCNGKERCATGQCVPGEPVFCPAADPCAERYCSEASGRCEERARPDGELCDDATFCTVEDRCEGGRCLGVPRCAAPSNPCVVGRCDEKARTCDVEPLLPAGQACHVGTDREGTCVGSVCEPAKGGGCSASSGPGTQRALPLLGLLVALLAVVVRRRRRHHGRA
ncbi:MAG: hypothetical protein IT371_20985 [Deltaproteobacteria bacterium]|nr:hypothetical protein [Deltaproteobacteria bacterium]